MKIFKLLILNILLFPSVGWNNEDRLITPVCKERLLTYLNKMEAVGSPIKGQVYHVKYRMKTTYNQGTGLDSEVADVEVFTTEGKMAVYDRKMSVFGDESNIFVVLPIHKRIYLNNSDPRIFNDVNTYKKFLEIQRALLNSAKSIDCVQQEDGLMLITVVPDSDFAMSTKLLHQKITYDVQMERIVKVDNIYNGRHKVKSQTITYHKLDFDSPKKIISPIEALFNENELKSVYRGFEIIDNRKK